MEENGLLDKQELQAMTLKCREALDMAMNHGDFLDRWFKSLGPALQQYNAVTRQTFEYETMPLLQRGYVDLMAMGLAVTEDDELYFLFLRKTRPDGFAGYYNHIYWKIVAGAIRDTRECICERCKKKCDHSEVHHKIYDHVGREFENTEDLELLCEVCHARHHNKPVRMPLCTVCQAKMQVGLKA